MRVLDLFSGIGGFSLGLERAGMQTVAFCEIEEFPRAVLRKHWPDVPIFEDVRKLKGADVGQVDLICAGFPCQDISFAGGGDGLDGARSGLWFECARLVKELGPRFVIIENVRALLGRGLGAILQNLSALGYDAEWHCIPACHVGAPQIRDRVWIIAYPSGFRMEGLFEGRGLGKVRQGWACRQEDLQQVFSSPFSGGRWPQPIIRRSDYRSPDWVDRIESLGNSLVPQIAEMIGRAIMEAAE